MTPDGPLTPDDPNWLWDALGLRVDIRRAATDRDDAVDRAVVDGAVVGGAAVGGADEPAGRALRDLVGLALRRNPRRAHLLVSKVLGKHLPVPPAVALDAGARLAELVRALPEPRRWEGQPPEAAETPLVIGYCETATALGHAVSDGLPDSVYLHTTRREVPGHAPLLEFVESHSHATHHWLMPEDPAVLTRPGRLVLVDDELSTGRTALGTIRILQAFAPRTDYAVAALVDARPPAARAAFRALAAELGIRLDVVSLVAATIAVPEDINERARAIRGSFGGGPATNQPPATVLATEPATASAASAASADTGSGTGSDPVVTWVTPTWPAGLPDGARHGWSQRTRDRLTAELPAVAAQVLSALRPARADGDILVLGTEELMYVPMRLAQGLAELSGRAVVYQSTTRSPVHPLDVDGYAIRSALTFPAPDDPGRVSQVYNVAPGRYGDIVLVVDAGLDGVGPVPGGPALDGLVAELSACAPVTVVIIPCYVPARGGHLERGA